MTDLFQGSPLPSTVTTVQDQTVAPEFYTNYLQDIANLGQNAVTQGGVAGASPLQEQAFNMAPAVAMAGANTAAQGANMAGSGANAYGQAASTLASASPAFQSALNTLGGATNMLQASGTTTAPSVVNNYMNPYVQNVVNEMARLQQQNIQRNVLPSLSAAGVSSGGFGSTRQATATGQTMADMQANLTGQQYGALNTGYQNALKAAQDDLTRQLQAGQAMTSAGQGYTQAGQGITSQAAGYENIGQGYGQLASNLGQLANIQSNIGQSGLKSLSDLGLTQRGIQQAALDYPMQQAQNFAKLLQGYVIPTGSTRQTTAPGQQGQFTNSPLSQIAGIGSLLQAISGGSSNNPSGPNASALTSALSASGITDPTQVAGILKALGLAKGGSVGYADGGAIQGGLQSIIQGGAQNINVPQSTEYTIPSNSNVPNLGYNPSRMVPQPLNDVEENFQESSTGGSVGSSNFNPMVG